VIFAAGLGVLLLLGLNGNAGYWHAKPNGQRVSAPSAPSAAMPKPAPQFVGKNLKRKNPTKKISAKVTMETTPKRRGRPKGSKNKQKGDAS